MLGLAVVTFSLFDIIKENKEVVNEIKNEDENEEAEAEEENDKDENVVDNSQKETKEDKTSLKYILIHCSIF